LSVKDRIYIHRENIFDIVGYTSRIGGIYVIIADMNELAAHCRQGKIKNGKYNRPNL
jgi:Holliday junction resolvase